VSGLRPLKNRLKNQLLSDRLAIYCDAPVYKAHTYVTEELLMDRKNSFPGNLFLTIPSKDSGRQGDNWQILYKPDKNQIHMIHNIQKYVNS